MDSKQSRYCKFLGLKDDPDTALAYLSPWNYCHNTKPATQVGLEHQQNYCLAENYADCPIFAGRRTKLPNGGRHATGQASLLRPLGVGRMRFIVPMIGLLVIALVVWRLFAGGIFGRGGNGSLTPLATVTDTEMVVTVQTPLQKTPSTRVPATVTPTITPSPTRRPDTPTPTLKLIHGLETPIGKKNQLIIHVIQEGESLDLLANRHGTTVQAILAVNYSLVLPLYPGNLVVIPVMMVDVEELPAFEPYQVLEDGLMIEALASRLSLDSAELIYYNDLYEGYLLSKGEWLLIPHEKPGH